MGRHVSHLPCPSGRSALEGGMAAKYDGGIEEHGLFKRRETNF